MERRILLEELAARLCARRLGHPLRVGIDGACGVGKSTFALDLVPVVQALGRPVLHVDSDGFHHVRAVRYRQGRSARGYYEDAYDVGSLRDLVLRPLGAGGAARIATRVHDLATDATVLEEATVPEDAVVLFAATFLQRGALRDCWDEVVHLDAPVAVAQERGVRRDAAALGGRAAATAAYDSRYSAACRIYEEEEHPTERASVLIDHTDPAQPVPVLW